MATKPETEEGSGLADGLFLFVIVLLFWMLLTGSLDPSEIITGAVVALVVTLTSRPHLAIYSGVRLTPMAILPIINYLGVFFWELILANIDMARRVLSPSLPLRPAVVEVRTDLRSPLGRLALANSITLTPGTLTVDVQDQTLLVHWVDAPPGIDIENATRKITTKFERHLKGFLK
ncbi:MAG: Na+/H+ antiporter subunit E [Candidatus Thiodiazotropha sp. (ex Lucinoma kastoroae)]|nr:Na+/H+ antiporter subunit E [Candidatus Thiodiazotropha sp. (ex Lucinoma kastoroae)]